MLSWRRLPSLVSHQQDTRAPAIHFLTTSFYDRVSKMVPIRWVWNGISFESQFACTWFLPRLSLFHMLREGLSCFFSRKETAGGFCPLLVKPFACQLLVCCLSLNFPHGRRLLMNNKSALHVPLWLTMVGVGLLDSGAVQLPGGKDWATWSEVCVLGERTLLRLQVWILICFLELKVPQSGAWRGERPKCTAYFSQINVTHGGLCSLHVWWLLILRSPLLRFTLSSCSGSAWRRPPLWMCQCPIWPASQASRALCSLKLLACVPQRQPLQATWSDSFCVQLSCSNVWSHLCLVGMCTRRDVPWTRSWPQADRIQWNSSL